MQKAVRNELRTCFQSVESLYLAGILLLLVESFEHCLELSVPCYRIFESEALPLL
jgi:hypothetical protein